MQADSDNSASCSSRREEALTSFRGHGQPGSNHSALRIFSSLLPHEAFFGLFLLVMTVRVIAVEGIFGSDSLFYLTLIIASAFAFWFSRSRNTPLAWRLSMIFYPIAMNLIFTNMKVSVPRIHAGKLDWLLQKVDAHVIGMNLSLRIQSLTHPLLTEVFSFCYALFFLYLLFSLIYYFFAAEIGVLKKFIIGLFTIYGIGFLGYSFVPAAGPCHAMASQFTVPLQGWWITRLNDWLVSVGSNGVDVFPSLHCAVSAYFLFFDRRHRPWRFRLYLVPCVGLWFSTIYLRYHYTIDLIFGFALAAFGLWLAKQFPLGSAGCAGSQEPPLQSDRPEFSTARSQCGPAASRDGSRSVNTQALTRL